MILNRVFYRGNWGKAEIPCGQKSESDLSGRWKGGGEGIRNEKQEVTRKRKGGQDFLWV